MNIGTQRQTIAEVCGYTGPFKTTIEAWSDEGGGGDRAVTRDASSREIPDYLSDLNAMHEAEKVLSKEQRHEYSEVLFSVIHGIGAGPWSWPSDGFFATAAQRAEAFLRTLGKWTD